MTREAEEELARDPAGHLQAERRYHRDNIEGLRALDPMGFIVARQPLATNVPQDPDKVFIFLSDSSEPPSPTDADLLADADDADDDAALLDRQEHIDHELGGQVRAADELFHGDKNHKARAYKVEGQSRRMDPDFVPDENHDDKEDHDAMEVDQQVYEENMIDDMQDAENVIDLIDADHIGQGDVIHEGRVVQVHKWLGREYADHIVSSV